MARTVWKGSPLTAPVPVVLVTCGDMENPNIITVAWTGTVCSDPPMTYISVRPERYSYGLIKEKGEFCVNFAPAELYKKVDYCGIFTGRKVNKAEKCGFGFEPASEVSVPIIDKCPLALECRVKDVIHLGSHDMFLAEIVATDLSPELIDENGKLRLERARLISYSHGDYLSPGRRLGSFGCSSVKKNSKAKRNQKS
ncbi:MAG: flavin reductase family protein [Clostridia bacterium]|nr:flavin reductase family protein [Clostridia bacterium]